MYCTKNTYEDLSSIVFAYDQHFWSGESHAISDISVWMNITVKFREAWDIMATNSYSSLSAGPEAGWPGFYSFNDEDM